MFAHDLLDDIAERVQKGGSVTQALKASRMVTIPKSIVLDDDVAIQCSASTIQLIAFM